MERTAAIILALSFCLGFATAQEASVSVGERLQNCVIDAPLPEQPAAAEQGGFRLEYQSFRGVTEDDRVCTVYRLRNSVDKPPTPFRWRLADEPVVEKARLGRCEASADGCPWMTFVKYFAGSIDSTLSTLSYGLNADAFHEQATTYLNHQAVDGSSTAERNDTAASSVGTEIAGTFGTVDGADVDVHVVVKSRFEPNAGGGYRLVYEVEDLAGEGTLSSGELRYAWDAFTAIDAVGTLLDRAGPVGVAEVHVDGIGTLVRTEDTLAISVLADAFTLQERLLFHVYEAESEEPVVSVEMAAYVPVAGSR